MKYFVGLLGLLIVGVTATAFFMMPEEGTPSPSETPGDGMGDQIYTSTDGRFSVRLPSLGAGDMSYTVDASYAYDLRPGETIAGVRFTIPKNLTEGTNLSEDTALSIESLPDQSSCSANLFLDGDHDASSVTDNDVVYSVASSSNAGAGNRYEEMIYALPGSAPCTAIRYSIHYTTVQNYPEGTVTEFDRTALLEEFDAIRKSLTIQ